jgi:opacity protein-like surface antigen
MPYAKAGFGLYNMGLQLNSPSGDVSDSQSEFGFNVGGGMNFRTQSNMSWGVSGAYHIVQAENDLGSNVNFFQVGINANWGTR